MRRIDLVIASAARLPGAECEIFVAQLGGAMGARRAGRHRLRRPRRALHHERARPLVAIAADDEQVRDWARQVFQAAAPHATGSGYVNFLTEDEGERVAASYGAQLRAPAGREAPLRSGQPVPHEPQHRAGGRRPTTESSA